VRQQIPRDRKIFRRAQVDRIQASVFPHREKDQDYYEHH
jgi:hypothetical protein